MKIVTVNVPESYIEIMAKLVGANGLYPSRSELIRCAVRQFLLKELENAKNLVKYNDSEPEEFDDKNFVQVPSKRIASNGETVREFKTYKIIKRLEY